MNDDKLAAAEAAVLSAMDTEARFRRLGAAVAALAVAGLFFAVALLAKTRPDERELMMSTPVVLVIAGLVAARVRPLAPLAVALVMISIGVTIARSTSEGYAWGGGLDCFLTVLIAAALPAASVLAIALRNHDPVGVAALAQVGAIGALAGQLAVTLVCAGRHETGHLWLFHFGGAVLATAIITGVAMWRRRAQRRG